MKKENSKTIKILAIGDFHGKLDKLKTMPLGDINLFLLTGDLGTADLMRSMAFDNIRRKKLGLPEREYSSKQRKKVFMEAYDSSIRLVKYLSRFAPVYTIFGNVESSNADTRKESKEIGLKLPFLYNKLNSIPNVRVINNRAVNFHGIKIGGLNYFTDVSWVRTFKPSNYRRELHNATKETNRVKEALINFGSLDILLCHQPPFGILDKVEAKSAPSHWKGKHAGSMAVLEYIKREHPRYVFCGHIHEARGKRKMGSTEIFNLGEAGYRIVILIPD